MGLLSKLLRLPKAFLHWTAYLTRLVGQVGLVILTIIVGYEVFVRYLLNKPTSWSVDYASLLSVMVAFLGLSYVTEIEGHISVSLVVQYLSDRKRHLVSFFTNIIALLLISGMLWQLWELSMRSYQRGLVSNDSGTPLSPFMTAVFACLVLAGLQFLAKIIENARAAFTKN
ncbi:TRAP transporter small permease [Chloroflexota bacterium]